MPWVLLAALSGFMVPGDAAMAQGASQFTTDFRLKECTFKAKGENPYFPLKPGRQAVLEGEEDGEIVRVEITVLHETKKLRVPGIGPVTTRIVQERHWTNGVLVEVSKNFFATCKKRNDVIYFGEDVDIIHEDGTVTHDGEWRAGRPDANGLAQAGLVMPGTFLLGSRYFQEIAEGIALDRAMHADMGLTVTTAAGRFRGCVEVNETTPLEPGAVSVKVYCPGVGLVMDNGAKLVKIHRVPGGHGDEDEEGD